MEESKKKIQQKLEKIQKVTETMEKKSTRLQHYVSEMTKDNIKLSWNALVELAIKFANENDEEFYKFMRANYESIRAQKPEYVPPSGFVVSTTKEEEACVAAVLGIGIGWIWAWLAVSPWAVTE